MVRNILTPLDMFKQMLRLDLTVLNDSYARTTPDGARLRCIHVHQVWHPWLQYIFYCTDNRHCAAACSQHRHT